MAFLVVGCVQEEAQVLYDDLEIKEISYAPPSNPDLIQHPAITSSGKIQIPFKVMLKSNKPNTYYQLKGIFYESGTGSLGIGDNLIESYFALSSLGENPTLEVCFSKNYFFDKNESGVICKQKTLTSPKLDVSFSPDSVTLTVNKSIFYFDSFPSQLISIKNTGELPLRLNNFFSSGFGGINPNEPLVFGEFVCAGGNSQDCSPSTVYLNPGEAIELTVKATHQGTAVTHGTYQTKAYVYSLHTKGIEDAKFKKGFTVETKIIE